MTHCVQTSCAAPGMPQRPKGASIHPAIPPHTQSGHLSCGAQEMSPKTRTVLCSVWPCGSNMRITSRRACCSVCVTRQSDGVHIHSWRMKGSQGQISCAHVCTEYEACGRKHVHGSPEKETVEKQKTKKPMSLYNVSHERF